MAYVTKTADIKSRKSQIETAVVGGLLQTGVEAGVSAIFEHVKVNNERKVFDAYSEISSSLQSDFNKIRDQIPAENYVEEYDNLVKGAEDSINNLNLPKHLRKQVSQRVAKFSSEFKGKVKLAVTEDVAALAEITLKQNLNDVLTKNHSLVMGGNNIVFADYRPEWVADDDMSFISVLPDGKMSIKGEDGAPDLKVLPISSDAKEYDVKVALANYFLEESYGTDVKTRNAQMALFLPQIKMSQEKQDFDLLFDTHFSLANQQNWKWGEFIVEYEKSLEGKRYGGVELTRNEKSELMAHALTEKDTFDKRISGIAKSFVETTVKEARDGWDNEREADGSFLLTTKKLNEVLNQSPVPRSVLDHYVSDLISIAKAETIIGKQRRYAELVDKTNKTEEEIAEFESIKRELPLEAKAQGATGYKEAQEVVKAVEHYSSMGKEFVTTDEQIQQAGILNDAINQVASRSLEGTLYMSYYDVVAEQITEPTLQPKLLELKENIKGAIQTKALRDYISAVDLGGGSLKDFYETLSERGITANDFPELFAHIRDSGADKAFDNIRNNAFAKLAEGTFSVKWAKDEMAVIEGNEAQKEQLLKTFKEYQEYLANVEIARYTIGGITDYTTVYDKLKEMGMTREEYPSLFNKLEIGEEADHITTIKDEAYKGYFSGELDLEDLEETIKTLTYPGQTEQGLAIIRDLESLLQVQVRKDFYRDVILGDVSKEDFFASLEERGIDKSRYAELFDTLKILGENRKADVFLSSAFEKLDSGGYSKEWEETELAKLDVSAKERAAISKAIEAEIVYRAEKIYYQHYEETGYDGQEMKKALDRQGITREDFPDIYKTLEGGLLDDEYSAIKNEAFTKYRDGTFSMSWAEEEAEALRGAGQSEQVVSLLSTFEGLITTKATRDYYNQVVQGTSTAEDFFANLEAQGVTRDKYGNLYESLETASKSLVAKNIVNKAFGDIDSGEFNYDKFTDKVNNSNLTNIEKQTVLQTVKAEVTQKASDIYYDNLFKKSHSEEALFEKFKTLGITQEAFPEIYSKYSDAMSSKRMTDTRDEIFAMIENGKFSMQKMEDALNKIEGSEEEKAAIRRSAKSEMQFRAIAEYAKTKGGDEHAHTRLLNKLQLMGVNKDDFPELISQIEEWREADKYDIFQTEVFSKVNEGTYSREWFDRALQRYNEGKYTSQITALRNTAENQNFSIARDELHRVVAGDGEELESYYDYLKRRGITRENDSAFYTDVDTSISKAKDRIARDVIHDRTLYLRYANSGVDDETISAMGIELPDLSENFKLGYKKDGVAWGTPVSALEAGTQRDPSVKEEMLSRAEIARRDIDNYSPYILEENRDGLNKAIDKSMENAGKIISNATNGFAPYTNIIAKSEIEYALYTMSQDSYIQTLTDNKNNVTEDFWKEYVKKDVNTLNPVEKEIQDSLKRMTGWFKGVTSADYKVSGKSTSLSDFAIDRAVNMAMRGYAEEYREWIARHPNATTNDKESFEKKYYDSFMEERVFDGMSTILDYARGDSLAVFTDGNKGKKSLLKSEVYDYFVGANAYLLVDSAGFERFLSDPSSYGAVYSKDSGFIGYLRSLKDSGRSDKQIGNEIFYAVGAYLGLGSEEGFTKDLLTGSDRAINKVLKDLPSTTQAQIGQLVGLTRIMYDVSMRVEELIPYEALQYLLDKDSDIKPSYRGGGINAGGGFSVEIGGMQFAYNATSGKEELIYLVEENGKMVQSILGGTNPEVDRAWELIKQRVYSSDTFNIMSTVSDLVLGYHSGNPIITTPKGSKENKSKTAVLDNLTFVVNLLNNDDVTQEYITNYGQAVYQRDKTNANITGKKQPVAIPNVEFYVDRNAVDWIFSDKADLNGYDITRLIGVRSY